MGRNPIDLMLVMSVSHVWERKHFSAGNLQPQPQPTIYLFIINCNSSTHSKQSIVSIVIDCV